MDRGRRGTVEELARERTVHDDGVGRVQIARSEPASCKNRGAVRVEQVEVDVQSADLVQPVFLQWRRSSRGRSRAIELDPAARRKARNTRRESDRGHARLRLQT